MKNNTDEQLIFAKDLLFVAAYRWKAALVVGLVFALLLGAFGVLSNRDTVSVGGVSLTPQIQEKVTHLENKLDTLNTNIEKLTQYREESMLINLDPYNICSSGYLLYVRPQYTSPQENPATAEADLAVLTHAYQSCILTSGAIEEIAKQLQIDRKYAQELLSFDRTVPGVLSVSIKCQTAQQADAAAQVLLQAALDGTQTLNDKLLPHTVTTTAFRSGPVHDTGLRDIHAASEKALTNYESERVSVETELKKYAPTQLVPDKKNPLLYAIIGGVLGVILVVCYAWVAHLGSNKVYSARVLTNRTGLRVLGCVRSEKKRSFLDLWLRKLEGRATHTQLDAVTENIRNRCQDGKNLLIMGRFQPEQLKEVTTALEQSGIHCQLCNDPSVKADALRALPACDAVVFAEVCGESNYDSVIWAAETVTDHNKPLLGCVLIDG